MYKQIQQTAPVTVISEVFNRDIHRYITQGSESVRALYRRKSNVADSFVHVYILILMAFSSSQYYFCKHNLEFQ